MAHMDVVVQWFLQNVGLPLIVLLVLVRISRKWLLYGFDAFYACGINRMGTKYTLRMHKYKEELFADMSVVEDADDKSGRPLRILDVGAGAGSNFKYYPRNSDVICLEPNARFESYLRKNVSGNNSHLNLKEFIVGCAEDLSMIPSDSIDAAVCTLVLCNVDDINQSLREIKRVLKTGGKLYYLEHVCADTKTWTYLLQRLLNPIWQHTVGRGCRFTQKTWLDIENAGFSRVKQRRFTAPGRILGIVIHPHLLGIATK